MSYMKYSGMVHHTILTGWRSVVNLTAFWQMSSYNLLSEMSVTFPSLIKKHSPKFWYLFCIVIS